MLDVAYLFPGQGAQYLGMGEDFYQRLPLAKEIFAQADNLLGFSLSELIFKGPPQELTRTLNCQAAIFTVSIVALRLLEAEYPKISVKYTAGLSLGEYAALVASGAVEFGEALKLVRKRAEYMEETAQANPGAMLSLIGLSLDCVADICAKTTAEVANLNCPGQIVVSCRQSCVDEVTELARAQGAKKVIPLKVSGAFHSSLMEPAKQKLLEALREVEVRVPKVPVVSNVTAREETAPHQIKENLARQIVCGVMWEDSIKFIRAQGVRHFLEIGPGKVLKGLLGKIDPDLKVYNIETVEDLEELFRFLT